MKLRAVWNFLWKSNSPLSWIADLVLFFLIIKFLVFPFFGLIFNTNLPFVIIESSSLEHKLIHPCLLIDAKGSCIKRDPNSYEICGKILFRKESLSFDRYWELCGGWYEERNLTKAEFSKWPYSNGLNKGDIIVVKGMKNYKKGDIIIFKAPGQKKPIIHRIVAIEEGKVFSTKGDHNELQANYEIEITQEQILGKAVARLPWLGWIKLALVELIS